MWLSPWLKTFFPVFTAAHKKAFAKQGWKHTGICGTCDIFVPKISWRDRVHRKCVLLYQQVRVDGAALDPALPSCLFCRTAQILQFFATITNNKEQPHRDGGSVQIPIRMCSDVTVACQHPRWQSLGGNFAGTECDHIEKMWFLTPQDCPEEECWFAGMFEMHVYEIFESILPVWLNNIHTSVIKWSCEDYPMETLAQVSGLLSSAIIISWDVWACSPEQVWEQVGAMLLAVLWTYFPPQSLKPIISNEPITMYPYSLLLDWTTADGTLFSFNPEWDAFLPHKS